MRTKAMILTKSTWLILLLPLLCLGCIGPAQQLTPADKSIIRPDASSIVVVHSRTGNTAHVGRLVSDAINADYIRLDVPEGSQDSLISVPSRHENMKITPQKIDLSKYQLVFLGSPIWFMHPTAFIYSFIKNNDFTLKNVVLFYTYGGSIADDAVAEWEGLIQQKGGKVIDVIGIQHSSSQTREALEVEVNAIIDRQRSKWIENMDK